MPKLKYTPGDWQLGFSDGSGRPDESRREGGWVLRDNSGRGTPIVMGGKDDWNLPQGVTGETQEEAEANGILLANAARMYEALRELLDKIQSVKWDGFDALPAMRARALIEKMEGEAK